MAESRPVEETTLGRRTVAVWDPAVRLFHWTLVSAVAVELLPEAGGRLHDRAGYLVLGLVLLRLVWGVVGGRHARFRDFVHGPAAIREYLKGLLAGRPRHYLGHNPAGGLMVVLLLTALLTAGGSGALLDTDAWWGNATLEDLHEAAGSAFYVLVPLHVLGVIVSSWAHRENLVGAMITGRKRVE